MRFYQFKVEEIVDDAYPDLDLEIDPKLSWALRHPEQFPVDINRADYEMLLRIPGVGVKSARLIVASRRFSKLGFYELKKIGIVMKKAQYFFDGSVRQTLIQPILPCMFIYPPYIVKSFFLIFQGIFSCLSQLNEPMAWIFLYIWYKHRRKGIHRAM